MDKKEIEWSKKDIIKEMNKSVEVIKKILPQFSIGKIYKREEEKYFSISYSTGEDSHIQTQKYLEIKIEAIFFDELMELYYQIKIADENRPFSWQDLEKFELEKLDLGYVSNSRFNRWILMKLRKREEEMKDKFNYLIENYVKIIGTHGTTEPSKELLKAIVEGMNNLGKTPIIIEISHTDKYSSNFLKSISYALFDWHDWLLFPDFCNEGDSGEGGGGYFELKNFFDKKIKEKKVKIWYKDIDLNEFEKKIKEYTPIKYAEYVPKENNKILIKTIFTRNNIIDRIVKEINNCFNEGLHIATGFLIRKLIEESAVQKIVEKNPNINRKDLINNKKILEYDQIRDSVKDSHLLGGIKNIFYLESADKVHGINFTAEGLEIEAKIVDKFLKELFPKKRTSINNQNVD